jgi:hypothetical protein
MSPTRATPPGNGPEQTHVDGIHLQVTRDTERPSKIAHRDAVRPADKAYDAEDFVNELRSMKVTPHVAQNTSGRSSAIDGGTTRHAGYAVSQRIRKRIKEAFGWIKMVAGLEQTKFRGAIVSDGLSASPPPPTI